jgi:hypothetical protein
MTPNGGGRMARVLASARRAGPTIGVGFLAFAVPFALEYGPEYVQEHESCEPSEGHPFLQSAFFYHHVTRFNSRSVANKFTRIVTVSLGSEGAEPGCVGRELHARLLEQLLREPPGAIVLDFAYTEEACKSTSAESLHLQRALAMAVSQHIPITLGLWDLTETERLNEGIQLPHSLKVNQAVLDPFQTWRPVPEGSHVGYGLKRLQCDVEAIPLAWPTYLDTTLNTQQTLPTLAKAAVNLWDRKALEEPRVHEAVTKDKDLLVPFLDENEITKYTATQVLCGHTVEPGLWKNCNTPGNRNTMILDDLRSRIVVIYEVNETDRHNSPIGSVPGGVLQANYVESLLDRTYYGRVGFGWTWAVAFAWFAVIQAIFWKYDDHISRIAFLVAIVCVLFGVLCYVIFVRLFGVLLLPWPPVAITIIGKCTEIWIKKLGGGPYEAKAV